jgi:hypothetical protein
MPGLTRTLRVFSEHWSKHSRDNVAKLKLSTAYILALRGWMYLSRHPEMNPSQVDEDSHIC